MHFVVSHYTVESKVCPSVFIANGDDDFFSLSTMISIYDSGCAPNKHAGALPHICVRTHSRKPAQTPAHTRIRTHTQFESDQSRSPCPSIDKKKTDAMYVQNLPRAEANRHR